MLLTLICRALRIPHIDTTHYREHENVARHIYHVRKTILNGAQRLNYTRFYFSECLLFFFFSISIKNGFF